MPAVQFIYLSSHANSALTKLPKSFLFEEIVKVQFNLCKKDNNEEKNDLYQRPAEKISKLSIN